MTGSHYISYPPLPQTVNYLTISPQPPYTQTVNIYLLDGQRRRLHMKKGKSSSKSMPSSKSGGKKTTVGLISTPSKLAKACGKGK